MIGPKIAASSAREADERRFDHERKLKSSDDLIARVDDVAVALDELGAACATMRQAFLSLGVSDIGAVWPLVRAAEDAYQRAQALNSRLGMRPHAHDQVLKKGEAAAASMNDAIRHAREALIRRRAASRAVGVTAAEAFAAEAMGPVIESIEQGYKRTKEYEALARVAIGKLLAAPS